MAYCVKYFLRKVMYILLKVKFILLFDAKFFVCCFVGSVNQLFEEAG